VAERPGAFRVAIWSAGVLISPSNVTRSVKPENGQPEALQDAPEGGLL